MKYDFKKGDRVWRTDPDDALCSGPGTIVSLQHVRPIVDTIISLKMDSGSEAEVLPYEIHRLEDHVERKPDAQG